MLSNIVKEAQEKEYLIKRETFPDEDLSKKE